MTARRLEVPEGETLPAFDEAEVSYWKLRGVWYIHLPGPGVGTLVNHTIEEHPDGTISVSPSVLLTRHLLAGDQVRHGYLTCGEWRDC